MSLGGTMNNLPAGSVNSKKQRIHDDFSQPTKIRQVLFFSNLKSYTNIVLKFFLGVQSRKRLCCV